MSIPCGIKIFSIRKLCLLPSNCRCIVTAMIFHLWLLNSLTHFMDRFLLFLLRSVCKLMDWNLSFQWWFTSLSVLQEICRTRVTTTCIRPEPRSRETRWDGVLWIFDLAEATTRRNLSVGSTVSDSSSTGLQETSDWGVQSTWSIRRLPCFMI
jgi:hypothetical protein